MSSEAINNFNLHEFTNNVLSNFYMRPLVFMTSTAVSSGALLSDFLACNIVSHSADLPDFVKKALSLPSILTEVAGIEKNSLADRCLTPILGVTLATTAAYLALQVASYPILTGAILGAHQIALHIFLQEPTERSTGIPSLVTPLEEMTGCPKKDKKEQTTVRVIALIASSSFFMRYSASALTLGILSHATAMCVDVAARKYLL
jgi:hypothetical protein